MCHLILLLPIAGLVVFWIWPLPVALPVYIGILTISLLIYAALMKAMRRPVTTGREGIIGKEMIVLDMVNHRGHVKGDGGIWSAVCEGTLRAGEKVVVTAVNGLKLTVARKTAEHTKLAGSHCGSHSAPR